MHNATEHSPHVIFITRATASIHFLEINLTPQRDWPNMCTIDSPENRPCLAAFSSQQADAGLACARLYLAQLGLLQMCCANKPRPLSRTGWSVAVLLWILVINLCNIDCGSAWWGKCKEITRPWSQDEPERSKICSQCFDNYFQQSGAAGTWWLRIDMHTDWRKLSANKL